MICVLKHLEVRRFNPCDQIINELDESSELYFVQSGRYDIGYEINNKKTYRLQFGARTLIGAFATTFNQRHYFLYQAKSKIDAFALRKKSWI